MSKEVLQLRNAFLERLQEVDPHSLGAAELGERIRLCQSTVDLLQLRIAQDVAVLDRTQAFLELGRTSTIEWLRANTHVSGAAADKQVTLARQLPELAPTVEAVESGVIGFEHAIAIAREVKDLPDSAQAELLSAAVSSDPKELRQVGERIRHREDPEDANARAYRQFQKRRLRLFDHPDGMLGLEGAVAAPEGMKLRLCLESLIGIPEKGDERTQEQRQADALASLCGVAIGSGRLPLDFGRARRLFSEPQRQEISTRHPTCVVDGCTVPSRKCQPHHEDWWKEGGATDVRKGLPLCWNHHPLVTEGGYSLLATEGGGYELVRRRIRSG